MLLCVWLFSQLSAHCLTDSILPSLSSSTKCRCLTCSLSSLKTPAQVITVLSSFLSLTFSLVTVSLCLCVFISLRHHHFCLWRSRYVSVSASHCIVIMSVSDCLAMSLFLHLTVLSSFLSLTVSICLCAFISLYCHHFCLWWFHCFFVSSSHCISSPKWPILCRVGR